MLNCIIVFHSRQAVIRFVWGESGQFGKGCPNKSWIIVFKDIYSKIKGL